MLAELRDTPMIDKAFLILMGNNQVLFELIRDQRRARGCATRSPGGSRRPAATASSSSTLAASSCGSRATATSTRSTTHVAGFEVTPRQVLEAIGGAVDELGLPHPVHVHANNLGVAGNADTTLDTMRTLDGRQAHFAHLQFHCLRRQARAGRLRSRAPELLDYLTAHPEVTRRRRPGDVRRRRRR